MEIILYATEDKINFGLDENNNIDFYRLNLNHGIISGGLLKKFQKENLSMSLWYDYVTLLNNIGEKNYTPALEHIDELVLSTKTLSFAHSTFCAREAVVNYVFEKYDPSDIVCEVISLQEGHISGVWKVDIFNNNGIRQETVILNIARDYDSGIELIKISEMMKKLAEIYKEVVIAKVHSIEHINLDYHGTNISVIVTINEHINHAKNIFYRDVPQSGDHQYYIADGFLAQEGDDIGPIKNVLAREASEEINKQINELVVLLTQMQINGALPEIDINRGDLVWDGIHVALVGLSIKHIYNESDDPS